MPRHNFVFFAAISILGASLCNCAAQAPQDDDIEMSSPELQNGTPAPAPGSRTGRVAAIVSLNGCTGTLVRSNWVLTASHCVSTDGEVFGSDSVSHEGTGYLAAVPADDIYNFTDIGAVDAALLKLQIPINPDVSWPQLFTGQDTDVVGKKVTTYGYGGSASLTYAPFTVDHITANSEMNSNPIYDGKYLVVPANDAGQDTTGGDSGGPTFLDTNNQFRDQLVGITGGGHWRAYAKLFRDWVDTSIGKDSNGVLHPPYRLSFYLRDNRRVQRIPDWASGQWKSECGNQYAAAGLSYDQNAWVPNPQNPNLHVALPGPQSILCRNNPFVGTAASTAVDFSTASARRDTTTGLWDTSGRIGECAANEALTGMAQTKINGTTGRKLSVALCTPLTYTPNTSRTYKYLPLDGTTKGTLNDGWAYNGVDNYGYYKAECPLNYFVKGVSVSNSAPRQVQCAYDFHPDTTAFRPNTTAVSFANVDGGSTKRADLIGVRLDAIQVQISNGSDFNATTTWIDDQFKGTHGIYFADVTGDGKADAIVSNDFGITVRRSDGTKFLPNENWTNEAFLGNYGLYFADVTGDGKADAIVSNDFGITVRRSDGTKFLPNENWTNEAFLGKYGLYFADVTGDGKTDAIVSNDFGITVRLSDGTKFLPNGPNWTNEAFLGKYGLYFADVTGDGKADAIVSNDFGVTVRRSDGTKFLPNDPNWINGAYLGTYGTYFVDVTGDGRADAIVVNDFGITVRRSQNTYFGGNETWHPGI